MVTLLNTCFYYSTLVSVQKLHTKYQNAECRKIICKANRSECGGGQKLIMTEYRQARIRMWMGTI